MIITCIYSSKVLCTSSTVMLEATYDIITTNMDEETNFHIPHWIGEIVHDDI